MGGIYVGDIRMAIKRRYRGGSGRLAKRAKTTKSAAKMRGSKKYSRKSALVDNKKVSAGATRVKLHYDMGTWAFNASTSASTTDTYSIVASSDGMPIGFCFKLKNSLQYARYQTLFERYRITGVKVRFVPSNNTSPSGSTPYTLPYMFIKTGVDDANPAEVQTVTSCMSQDNLRIVRPTNIVTVNIGKPIVNGVVAQAGDNTTSAGVGQMVSPWLDTEGGADVGHFGLKVLLNDDMTSSLNVGQNVRIFVTLFCEFKDIKGVLNA